MATAVFPHSRIPAAMPSRSVKSTISRTFWRPRRSSAGRSSGHSCTPWAIPWVSDSEKKPPLRPEAPKAMLSASTRTTSADGSFVRASIAAHRPVSPPPTTSTSQEVPPTSGGAGGGAPGRSVQKGWGTASRRASAVRRLGWVIGSRQPCARRTTARSGAQDRSTTVPRCTGAVPWAVMVTGLAWPVMSTAMVERPP